MLNEQPVTRAELAGELADLSIATAADLLRDRQLSPVQLTQACLQRIESLNGALNVFITVTAELALAQAHAAEAEIQAGHWRGPLHGIPIALKDIIDVAGVRTTAASAVLRDHVAAEDAEVVTRLKQGGAVLIGKTNLHEFAYGGSSVVSYFGPVRNARNPEYITGGSSGGSATAIAAGMCLGAIGTDTAGSIRLPASFCGVVGLKPTYGLVSARGVIPLAWSYDHVGPIARTVTDGAIILQAIAGYDAADIFSRQLVLHDYVSAASAAIESLRIGVPGKPFFDELHPDIKAAVNRAVDMLVSQGSAKGDVCVPLERDRTAANCESYVYHAQFLVDKPEMYQPSTRERLLAGKGVTAAEYIEARHRLEQLRRDAISLFHDVDIIVSPTVSVPPPGIDELLAAPETMRSREVLMLRNTRPFNVLGTPAITVPCGATAEGLPIGLQIAAAPGREDILLSAAHMFERSFASSRGSTVQSSMH
jgi:aspartyl-tRNA(Asn)/glutamyl-tRNA(Gln) amidotransferase subunit A